MKTGKEMASKLAAYGCRLTVRLRQLTMRHTV